MNIILWETLFGKKGSLFTFGRGSIPFVLDGMKGFKTWNDKFIVKDENGNYVEYDREWNDEETYND